MIPIAIALWTLLRDPWIGCLTQFVPLGSPKCWRRYWLYSPILTSIGINSWFILTCSYNWTGRVCLHVILKYVVWSLYSLPPPDVNFFLRQTPLTSIHRLCSIFSWLRSFRTAAISMPIAAGLIWCRIILVETAVFYIFVCRIFIGDLVGCVARLSPLSAWPVFSGQCLCCRTWKQCSGKCLSQSMDTKDIVAIWMVMVLIKEDQRFRLLKTYFQIHMCCVYDSLKSIIFNYLCISSFARIFVIYQWHVRM